MAQVIVLALYADEVMEPLTRPDESRSWKGTFKPLDLFAGGWVIEYSRERPRSGLLKHLASLPWPNPGQVQVLIHDEEDDVYGLWTMQDGALVEVPLPGTQRYHSPAPPTDEFPPSPGYLWLADTELRPGADLSTERQDPRPAW
ncbi:MULTISPECIES: hypothetical protein [Streptomyces]|uniref:hypothetical protein n=1 Tax=Streptomyces TaxID=1883 RepID=UPI00164D4C38|nr:MULTISPECIES: hypothetical protein [Streptomyces]